MRTKTLLGLAVVLPLAAWAADDAKQFDAKPGLWEVTTSTEVPGMPTMPAMPQIPESALARMSPQQRAQMEAMMKGRGGAGGAQHTTKVCITRESLSAGAFGQTDKSCNSKVVSSSSNKQVIHVECTQTDTKITGDLTVERVDAEHVKGVMSMKSSMGEQTMDVKTSFSNKWISADCGDVKPVVPK